MKRTLIIFASIILLATLIRTWQIDLAEFKMDESGWLSVAAALIDEGKIPQIGTVDANTRNTMGIHVPPIMAYLMALPLLLSRNPAFATAFVALMNVLAVALVYWFTGRYFGKLEGQTAALLYAASTTAALYSRKIWSNFMLAPFVTLFFIVLALLFIERKRWHLALALVLLSWTLQLHISSMFLVVTLLLMATLFRRELHWKPALAGLLAGLILWVPYIVWIIQNQTDDIAVVISFISSGKAVTDLTALRSTLEMVTTGSTEVGVSVQAPTWIPSFQELFWFDYLYLLLLAAGFAITVRKALRFSSEPRARKINLMVLLWVVLPILLGIRHAVAIHRFYMLPLQPALFILMGISLAAIVRFLSRRAATSAPQASGSTNRRLDNLIENGSRAALAAVSVAVLLGIASQMYLFAEFVRWVEQGNAMKAFGYPPIRYELEAATKVLPAVSQKDPLVLVPDDTDTAKVFRYLLANKGTRFGSFTVDDTLMLPLGARDAVYLVPGNRNNLIRQLEANLPNAEWERVASSGGELQYILIKNVSQSLARVVDGDDFKRLSSDLDNGLRLVGYRLPNEIEPGRTLTGLLVLQVTRKASVDDTADYHLFNHLVDHADNKVAQRDSPGLPLRDWEVGDVRALVFALDLPADLPAGAYRWRLGAYDLGTMKRVGMRDSLSGKPSDSIDLGPIMIVNRGVLR